MTKDEMYNGKIIAQFIPIAYVNTTIIMLDGGGNHEITHLYIKKIGKHKAIIISAWKNTFYLDLYASIGST